jgi:hypothetical protein
MYREKPELIYINTNMIRVCVGIRVPPAETESWFCQRCIAKKQGSLKDKKKGRKKKSV